jgi:H2-forming N5,N10-methylenetetrahydromethanopterin dehydrogenase-like enzyme
MSKKAQKRLAHANMVWERDQLKAATAAEQLDKAIAAVEQYKAELTEQQISDVYNQVEVQKKEIEKFLLTSRDKYIKKLEELSGHISVPVPKV